MLRALQTYLPFSSLVQHKYEGMVPADWAKRAEKETKAPVSSLFVETEEGSFYFIYFCLNLTSFFVRNSSYAEISF